nr:MAG TPA: hypothetical protein [Caudoviricetes sp.]
MAEYTFTIFSNIVSPNPRRGSKYTLPLACRWY